MQKALVQEKIQQRDEEILRMQQSLEDQLQQNGEVSAVTDSLVPATEPLVPATEPLVSVTEPVVPAAEPVIPITEPVLPPTEPRVEEPRDCNTEQTPVVGNTAAIPCETKTAAASGVDADTRDADQREALQKENGVAENSMPEGGKDCATGTDTKDDDKDELAEQMQGIEVVS